MSGGLLPYVALGREAEYVRPEHETKLEVHPLRQLAFWQLRYRLPRDPQGTTECGPIAAIEGKCPCLRDSCWLAHGRSQPQLSIMGQL